MLHHPYKACHGVDWRCIGRQVLTSKRIVVVQPKAAITDPPSNAGEVVAWAQQQFLQEVSREKPDSSINLAKVCLLLALEEEAAKQSGSAPSATARTSATASTWSLSRLDALAAEVVDKLAALDDTQQPNTSTSDMPAADSSTISSLDSSNRIEALGTHPSTDSTHTDTGSRVTGQHELQLEGQQQVEGQQATAAASAAVRQQAQRYPMQALNAVNAVLFRRHGYAACNRYGASVDSQLSAVLEDGPGSVAALTILYTEVCSRLGLECGVKVVENGRYCLVWPGPFRQQQQQQQQPHRLPQPEQQQQQQQQLGDAVQQHPPVEAAQQQTLLSVGGDACVIDVYGEGALLPVREATELFGITQQELFAGSSKRELLAALLSELQLSHWCAAVGCSPSPALMTPLTAATAVRQAVRQLHGASIERAAAAASKRVVLLPLEPQPQLELALLFYFSGRYDDAWLELGSYLEQLKAAADREQQQQQQQDAGPSLVNTPEGSPAAASNFNSAVGLAGSTSSIAASSTVSSSSAASSRVTELHAAIQSMLIGGAVVPEGPPTAAPTAAEAALVSADKGSEGSQAQRQQDRELSDIVLLFQKLQLELMVAANKEG